jgi:hypothetical protein
MDAIPSEGLIFKYDSEAITSESYLAKFDDYIENSERVLNPNVDAMKAPIKMKVSLPDQTKKHLNRDVATSEILTLSDSSGKSNFIGEKANNDSKYGTSNTVIDM